MLEALLKQMEALINERGSAAVLREHLALLRERVGALERENSDLRAQLQQAKAQAQDSQQRLDRFARDNPKGLRCNGCGSVDLVRAGAKPDAIFGDLGVNRVVFRCRVCGAESAFMEDTMG
ncbi:hypothetical protein [Acidovorax lacteus]|uniref:Uncharacterized protein n=1 Tax=Acidovorax lacteus TaxID=1924988 RepID=A0ABP8L820_9BURK